MPEVNPSLSATHYNPLYQQSLDDYGDLYRTQVQSLHQEGFFVGQGPFRNHPREAEALAPKIPALIAITQLPYDINLEPRKQRAQQGLRRYFEITEGSRNGTEGRNAQQTT